MSVNSQAQNSSNSSIPQLIAGIFVLFGIAAIVTLIVAVSGAENVARAREAGDTGQLILEFLDTFGIFIPLILLGGGFAFLNLARELWGRDIVAAGWATMVLFWLMVFSVFGLGILIFNYIAATNPDSTLDTSNYPLLIVLILSALAISAFGWRWLNDPVNRRIHYTQGQETLTSRDSLLAWNLLLPTVIILVLIAARPLERTFIASLTDREFAAGADSGTQFVGFSNYSALLGFRFDWVPCEQNEDGSCLVDEDDGTIEFLRPRDVLGEDYRELRYRSAREYTFGERQLVLSVRDQDFFNALENTLFFTFVAVIAELILGMIIALAVNSKFAGRGLMRAAMLVPWAIPTVVSARLWEVMLLDNRAGVINDLLIRLSVIDSPIAWLANPDTQIWSLIFVDVWKTTPFMALLILAGLQTIPSDVYEAAEVDGANKVRQFFSITLPLLRPTIAVALVFRTLDSIRAFDVFDVLLGRQVQSIATYNQFVLVNEQEFGYASAVGVTIFVIILIFTIVYVNALGVEAD